MRTRYVAAVIAALMGAAAIISAVGALAAEGDRSPNAVPVRAPAGDVDARLRASFAVFRRAQTTEDVLPSQSAPNPMFGGNGDIARIAGVSQSGERVYLVPSNGGLCIATASAGIGVCGDLDEPDARSFAIVESDFCGGDVPKGGYRIIGAFADGISEVETARRDGSRTSHAVVSNVVVIEASKAEQPIASLRWTAPDGPHVIASLVPDDALGPCITPGA